MKRTVLLLLLALLVAMALTSVAFANGHARGEVPSVTTEAPAPPPPPPAPVPKAEACPAPVQTCAQAVGVITCAPNLPLAMAMNPVVKADCNDVFIVAGGSIFKYDRNMCLKKQANLSMMNCGTGTRRP